MIGNNMVIDCNIEVGYCHIGGMQMSVHAFCLSSRRAVAQIYPDGRVEHRTDPDWFTPYQRRGDGQMGPSSGPREIRLSTTPAQADLDALELGDIIYLDGMIYTARGVYMRALEDDAPLPLDLPAMSAANFHCSPAANIREDGSFDLGAVTATASFRFAKWLPQWMARTGARLIIGKGGMSSPDYQEYFVPNGAVYLSTVGYGTGALLGRGVETVEAVHWRDELGLAQAMWVIRAKKMGPFIVASDRTGACLFERENAKIAANLEKVYEGTKPAVLKRLGETDDRSDEMIV